MKLIINIPEEVYKLGTLGLYFDCYSMKLHDTILSGTPIPDNATNGEVVQTMFPYAEYNTYVDVVDRIAMADKDFEIHFDEDWWNSPYQKGDEE